MSVVQKHFKDNKPQTLKNVAELLTALQKVRSMPVGVPQTNAFLVCVSAFKQNTDLRTPATQQEMAITFQSRPAWPFSVNNLYYAPQRSIGD